MWRTLLITGAATVGLSLSGAAVQAQSASVSVSSGSGVHANAGVHTRSRVMTRTQTTAFARGPEHRPHGWSEGKAWWKHGSCAQTHTCKPPGLRR
jgi:hypothetical protein